MLPFWCLDISRMLNISFFAIFDLVANTATADMYCSACSGDGISKYYSISCKYTTFALLWDQIMQTWESLLLNLGKFINWPNSKITFSHLQKSAIRLWLASYLLSGNYHEIIHFILLQNQYLYLWKYVSKMSKNYQFFLDGTFEK